MYALDSTGAVTAAEKTTFCVAPGRIVKLEGVAVTPAGRPDTTTLIGEEKPLYPVAPKVYVLGDPA